MPDQVIYAALPVPVAWPHQGTCDLCGGLGVTGERYEMPGDPGRPVLLLEVICPACHGCGSGDPEHADCDPRAHDYPEEFGADQDDDDDPSGEPPCPSCGGRTWNAWQGFSGAGDSAEMAVLRVPCGCSEPLLVTGPDRSALAPYPATSEPGLS